MRTREGHGDGQGQCSPADKPREHQRLPECHRSGSGRGRLISRQSGPVICLAVSNCAEGPAEEAGRGGGRARAGVGRVMDGGEGCRWTGAPTRGDNAHWPAGVRNGTAVIDGHDCFCFTFSMPKGSGIK